jgi:hypothetical protein
MAVVGPGPPGRSGAPLPVEPPVVRLGVDGVVVLQPSGRLADVVEPCSLAIRTALAEDSRGVVCDLSAVDEHDSPGSVRALALNGAHPRDWPAVPVSVACGDPRLRDLLRRKPLARHLLVAESVRQALRALASTDRAVVHTLRLAPHPTAPRAARRFVAQALEEQGLDDHVPAARVVISELVTSAAVHTQTSLELSVATWNWRVRLAVRDGSPIPPRVAAAGTVGEHGRGLAIVDAFSAAWGALPTGRGGKVVWAVLAT